MLPVLILYIAFILCLHFMLYVYIYYDTLSMNF